MTYGLPTPRVSLCTRGGRSPWRRTVHDLRDGLRHVALLGVVLRACTHLLHGLGMRGHKGGMHEPSLAQQTRQCFERRPIGAPLVTLVGGLLCACVVLALASYDRSLTSSFAPLLVACVVSYTCVHS